MKPYYKKLTLNHARGLAGDLKNKIYTPLSDLDAEFFVTKEPVKFNDINNHKFAKITRGETWGALWDCAWFKISGTLPKGYNKDEIVFTMDFCGEACVFDDGGTPLRGLTNINSEFERSLGDPGKRHIPVSEVIKSEPEDGKFSFYVEAGCNDLFGKFGGGKIAQLCIAHINKELRNLYYDYSTLLMLCEALGESQIQHYSVLYALEKAYFALSRDYKKEEIMRAREILSVELERKNAENPLLEFYAIGHAHMDLAWLWPIRETRRKIGRTFSSMIANMDIYPDYIFGASQPQQWVWLKEDYPGLYKKVLQKVKEGRVEAQGAMWVEPDTNVTGGESLVRQIMYGKEFFQKECGVTPTIVWLPDVFGFTAALPQIMKKSGIDNFVTIKLSWSEFNAFPHNTFWWESLDGSAVLVHMPPELTYNGAATPQGSANAVSNFAEKGIVDKAMLVYGIGDGGGGPNRAHLERMSRMKNLLGTPPVKQRTSEQYFADLRKSLPDIKTFRGEMYLERHQGTYTTQARNKKQNRAMENALRKVEYLWSAAKINGANYPKEEIEQIWKEVLLYQFHDILPGSSIKRVYDESVQRYGELLKQTGELVKRAAAALGAKQEKETELLNMSPFKRTEVIESGNGFAVAEFEPLSTVKTLKKIDKVNVFATQTHIENEFISAQFDERGRLTGLINKESGMQTVSEGNRWQIYNDFGDAWDMNINYNNSPNGCMELKKAKPFTSGAEAGIDFEFVYNNSTLKQRASLTHGAKTLNLSHDIDWRESGKMLRLEFDTSIFTNEVTCDIQFGAIKRSVLKNYSQQFAQYEICAHKWVDLSRPDGGLSILNDCKYGYRAEDNKISINVLRSTNYPGEGADLGAHSFKFALYPHKNTVENSDTAALAYALNNPLAPSGAKIEPLVKTDKNNIVIETVKPAQDSNGIIVRMYENAGMETKTTLKCSFGGKWQETDMTEKCTDLLGIKNGIINLEFRPFEIKTIRILD